jgi:hypothetical protein
MTETTSDLGKRIEQVIAEHIAETRKVAERAVQRAFAGARPATGTRVAPRAAESGRSGKRRASADLAALGERFYGVLCSKPGETMAVLGAEVGASARELHRAVARLKQAGRVRAVGQRAHTRYFPLASSTAA